MKDLKTLEMLIEDAFDGATYQGDEETEKQLEKIVGGKWRCYDTKIDDGIDDEDDEYVMVSCFECGNVIVRIYYGNVTDEITYIRVSN